MGGEEGTAGWVNTPYGEAGGGGVRMGQDDFDNH